MPWRSQHPLLTRLICRDPLVQLGTQNHLLSKPVWKRYSSKGYETNHSTYYLIIICSRKHGHHSDRRSHQMMPLNEIITLQHQRFFITRVR
jgi:hypothetical protein